MSSNGNSFVQAIGASILVDKDENVSSVSKALNRKRKSGSFTEEDTQSMPRFNLHEFPELQSETGGDESYDNLAEKHVYSLEVANIFDISNI